MKLRDASRFTLSVASTHSGQRTPVDLVKSLTLLYRYLLLVSRDNSTLLRRHDLVKGGRVHIFARRFSRFFGERPLMFTRSFCVLPWQPPRLADDEGSSRFQPLA